MRTGVVDIGTNSTRLLICDVEDDRIVRELARQSEVTRLGEGVDASKELSPTAMERVFAVLADYRQQIEQHDCDHTFAVLTSAVRDAKNGTGFQSIVRERYGLDAHTISGNREAELTFLGATSERELEGKGTVVVIDVGGGSTEFVLGSEHGLEFNVSTQAGVVRQSERFLHSDPPSPAELVELGGEVRAIIDAQVPEADRARATSAIAVAGTATQSAAILQELEPYDPAKVHGYILSLNQLRELLDRTASLPLTERQQIRGLHPQRATSIVAGLAILIEALDAFGIEQVEASEHDILRGATLALARQNIDN